MRTSWRAYIELPPDEVLGRLDDVENVHGTVTRESVDFKWKMKGWRNSWEPRITGHVLPANDGSLVEFTLRAHPFVIAFTALHAIPFLGFSWLMGCAAFSWHANRAVSGIRSLMGHAVEDPYRIAAQQRTSDPTVVGAEAAAPWSLRSLTDEGTVTFTLRRDGWFGERSRALKVTALGVETDEGAMTWDELERVDVIEDDPDRLLRLAGATTSIDLRADKHELRDLFWLKDYLRSQDRRLGASSEELDEARRRVQRLSTMNRDRS
jgi:hypothetical protein